MSRMRMIVKCERCRKEEFVTLKGNLDSSIVYLIRANSGFRDTNVFDTEMLLCSDCQVALGKFKDFRKLQTEAFIANQTIEGMP